MYVVERLSTKVGWQNQFSKFIIKFLLLLLLCIFALLRQVIIKKKLKTCVCLAIRPHTQKFQLLNIGVSISRIITGGPSGGAWGMNLQSPEPLKHQPWYTHCNLPHWSILPSDNGANLWGHLSSKTFQALSFLSHHTTTSRPRIFLACGTLLSRSHTGITGYHWANQSNFSPWLSNSSSCSGGFSNSVETVGVAAVKSLDSNGLLWWVGERDELGRWLIGKLKVSFSNWGLWSSLGGIAVNWNEEKEEALRASIVVPCCLEWIKDFDVPSSHVREYGNFVDLR